MATEMTPQERAEYAAANIYDVVKRFAYPYASIEKIVLRAVTETRRAALLECSNRIFAEHKSTDSDKWIDLGHELRKLAQEG